MPLKIGDDSTDRPQLISWDPTNMDECLEAGEKAADLLEKGYTERPNCVWGEKYYDPPARDPNLGLFRILSDNGDDRVVWDRRDANQVREAYAKFKEFIDKGYTAYTGRAGGKRGHTIDSFDPSLEEIVLVPGRVPG